MDSRSINFKKRHLGSWGIEVKTTCCPRGVELTAANATALSVEADRVKA